MWNNFSNKHFRPLRTEYVLRLAVLLLENHKNEAPRPIAPSYICDMLQPLKSTMNLRSSMKGFLSVPPIRLVNYGQRSFSHAAPKLWNELPDTVRYSESLPVFKTRLKTYLFKRAYK